MCERSRTLICDSTWVFTCAGSQWACERRRRGEACSRRETRNREDGLVQVGADLHQALAIKSRGDARELRKEGAREGVVFEWQALDGIMEISPICSFSAFSLMAAWR